MSIQKRTKIFIGIAVLGAAILGGVAVATGFFPPHENASGAIGAVKKMNDQQIDKKDVVLGSAAGANDASFQAGQAGLGSRANVVDSKGNVVDSKANVLDSKGSVVASTTKLGSRVDSTSKMDSTTRLGSRVDSTSRLDSTSKLDSTTKLGSRVDSKAPQDQ